MNFLRANKTKVLSSSKSLHVFYQAFAEKKIGFIAASLIITFNFLEINIFFYESLRQYKEYPFSVVSEINPVTRYFYMHSYAELNEIFYNGLRYCAALINIFYLIMYLIMRRLASQGLTIRSVQRVFEFFTTFYIQIMLLPVFELNFRDLFCTDSTLDALGDRCLEGAHVAAFIFAAISAASGLIMTLLTLFYSMNGIYDKKNYFSGQNRYWEALIALLRLILPLIMANSNGSRTFLIAFTIFNTAASILLLAYFMKYFPYTKLESEYFTLVWLACYFSQGVGNLIYLVSDDEDNNADYLFLFTLVFSIPGVLYLYNALKKRLISKEKVSSTSVLIRQIQVILQLKRTDKVQSDEEIQFRGLFTRHKLNCHNLKCFCKREELFDPKKNKDFEPSKWANLKPLLLKYYVRYLFEDALDQGANDNDILIAYAEFLFQKFRNTHLAFYQIRKILSANKYLYPGHRLRIFKLQHKINSYITMRNTESLDKPLEIENLIFIEEQLEKVLNGMKKIILNSIAFWGYLYNKDIELDRLKTLAEDMDGSVRETTRDWNPLKPYLYKQKKIMYYYNWFLKDILQKRIILSEDEVDELFDNDTASVFSSDFINNLKDDHVIFEEHSAIVHMSGNSTELGRILKTNKGTRTLFGYSKEELHKSNVEILMPNMIAHKHDYYLNSHIISGKARLLYNQKKTFGKDKNGFIIPLWIVVKQLNNLDGQVQYAGLMRPLLLKKDEQNSYMLLNNFGEINGITKNLSEMLHLPKKFFQKSDVNLLLLAPKLIKHFFFAKILQNEKYTTNANNSSFNFEGSKNAGPFSTYSTFRVGSPTRFSPFMGTAGKKNPMKAFLELDRIKEAQDENIGEEHYEEYHKEEEASFFEPEPENQNGDLEIEFTLRIPKDLRKFVKEFNHLKSRHHGLLNNQQLLVDAIHNKTIHKSMMSEDGSSSPITLKGKRKMIGHLANFKHAVDAYIGALRFIAEKIVKSGNNNVYRVKGVVVTDYYGPDRDVVKYIKISEITKKVEKFTKLNELETKIQGGKSGPLNLKDASTSNINQWNNIISHSSTLKAKKSMKLLNSKTLKDSGEIKQKDSMGDEAKGNVPSESIKNIRNNDSGHDSSSPEGTPKSRTMKHQDSGRSEKKSLMEEQSEEQEPSNASSERNAIMNELKNNILTHYQSIYQKEDHLQIDRNFPSLRNVEWFVMILLLSLVPLNIIIYFIGPLTTYNHLNDAVNNLYTNEVLRRSYLRCHHSIITLLLDHQGYYDTLKVDDPLGIETMLERQMTILTESYENMLIESTVDEWTIVLYEYAPKVSKETTVDIEGSFNGSVIDIQNAIQRVTNSLFEIISFDRIDFVPENIDLQFYRANSFEEFSKILGGVTTEIFYDADQDFTRAENLSIAVLIFEALLFFISFWIILRLILIVIWSLKELLAIFTAIDNKQIVETERHFRRLLSYLEVSNKQYMTVHETFGPSFTRRETNQSKSIRFADEQKQKLQKKFKKINSVNFMRQDTIRILTAYGISISLCFILGLAFHLQIKLFGDSIQEALIDGQRFIKLSPIYLASIIALKELSFNQTTYETYNLPFIQDVLLLLDSTLTKTGYSSNLQFVQTFMKILDGNPCLTYKGSLRNEEEYEDCISFAKGRLKTGLIDFHNFYSDMVQDKLVLDGFSDQFGNVGPAEVYEYTELIEIIDNVFMDFMIIQWRNNMRDDLNSKREVLAILIAIVSILTCVVYLGAQKYVVGPLRKKFLFYRKIYNDYMLGEAPVKEKRIKAVLVKYKLLNK